MQFPVDMLGPVGPSELEQWAQKCMTDLLYSDPEQPEQLTLQDSTKVDISVSTVGLVPLYGCCDSQKVLALFAPADPFTPAALFLQGQWWSVSDVLRTSDATRNGLRQVETLGDRIVLYVLNRIVYRVQEMSPEELPFLCHGAKDWAKILWHNGEAVGFYSVKTTGSLCSSFSSRTYPLPVMDSMFVRKSHRGKGLGLHMLEDYVDSFKDDCLGLKYPLTTAMYKVCQSYLRAYPGDAELLWEVDSGRINQRTSVASKLHSMSLKDVSRTLAYTEQAAVTGTVHHTEETMEEVIVVKASKGSRHRSATHQTTEEQQDSDIRTTEEVTLLRSESSEVVQTKEMLEIPAENGTEIVVTELEEDAVLDKITSLQRSEEETVTLDTEEVPQNLNSLCSSVITVENVASEVEECSHSEEHHPEEDNSHMTASPQVTITMERVLRTRSVINIPPPSTVGGAESEMTQETKDEESAAEEITLHRKPLRGQDSSTTALKHTRASARLKKGQESATDEEDTQEQGAEQEPANTDDAEETGIKVCMGADDGSEENNTEQNISSREDLDNNLPSEIIQEEKEEDGDGSGGGEHVSETRVLRSGVRTTQSRQVEEEKTETVETVSMKRERTSGRKYKGRSKESAEEEIMEEEQQQTSDDKTVENDESPSPMETALDKCEPVTPETMEAGQKHTEDQEPAQSDEGILAKEDDVESDKAESSMETNKEAIPETVMDQSVIEAEPDKEPQPESLPQEEEEEETTIVETRSLRSGRKIVTATPKCTDLKVCAEGESTFEGNDNDVKSETNSPGVAPQAKDSEITSEASVDIEVIANLEESLSSTQDDIVETRVLRSGAKTASDVPTPRTTRRSKHLLEEEVVQTSTIKKGRKSVGRKQVTRSKGQLQEQATSSAEEETTEEVREVTSDITVTEDIEASSPVETEEEIIDKDECVNDSVLTESNESVAEDIKDQETALPEKDILEREEKMVEGETDTTMEDTVVEDIADTAEEKEEAASTADTVYVPLSTTEDEDTEKTESITERDMEPQPESGKEQSETEQDNEPEPVSHPEEAEETPVVETRTLRSGTKTIIATPTRTQSKVSEVAEITSEPKDKEDTQSESKTPEESPQPTTSQVKDPEVTSEEAPEAAVDTEEPSSVSITNQEESLASIQEEVIETRVLRSGALTTSTVPTPRTTRRSQRQVPEEVVKTPTIKQNQKSTTRKQITRSKGQAQEQAMSSAEEDTTGEVRQKTPDLTVTENVETSEEVEEEIVDKDEPFKDSVLTETKEALVENLKDQEPVLPEEDTLEKENEEIQQQTSDRTSSESIEMGSPVEAEEQIVNKDEPDKDSDMTETKEIVVVEVIIDQPPALPEEDTLEKENDEVQGETVTTVEEEAVEKSASADAAEEKEKAPSTADVASVPLSISEAEETEKTESTVETDKETRLESVTDQSVAEEFDKEPQTQSLPEEAEEEAPIVETRFLRSGTKTVKATPKRTQSKVSEAAEINSEPKDKEDTLKTPEEVPQSTSPQVKDPEVTLEEAPEEAVNTEEVSSVTITNQEESLTSMQNNVVETRVLRSGARTASAILTPRTTRRSQRLVQEEVIETPTIKQGRKSTARKRVTRSKGQPQEQAASSAEEDAVEEIQQKASDITVENIEMSSPVEAEEGKINEDEPVKDSVLTETKEIVIEEDIKDQKTAVLEEDTLEKENEQVEGETVTTVDEAAVEESACADAAEKKEEAPYTTDVESVPLSTIEADATEQTESTVETHKDAQPEFVKEQSVEEAETDKEPQPDSLTEEEATIVETRCLRSGNKIVTSTPKHTQSKMSAEAEIPSDSKDNEDVNKTKTPEKVPQSTSPQAKDPEVTLEEATEAAVETEDVSSFVITNQEGNRTPTQSNVVETRVLRSGARTVSTVPTPRTTRRSKRLVEQEVVETPTMKQNRKSTARKEVTRSKRQPQKQATSSTEEVTAEEIQQQTSDRTSAQSIETASPVEAEEQMINKDEPVKDSDLTGTKENLVVEVIIDQPPALPEEDTLEKENDEVKGETVTTVEEEAGEESTSADTSEEKEETPSTADVESFPLTISEAEETEKTESYMETDKEVRVESVTDQSVAEESNKEPQPQSLPEEAEEEAPIVETRSLRSGTKTVAATPKRTQSKVSEAAEINSEPKDKEDTLKTPEEVPPSTSPQVKDPEVTLEEAPEAAVNTEEVSSVTITNQEESLTSMQNNVVETRVLRSGARTASAILTPRTTRSRQRLVQEEVIETPTIKQGQNSTARNQVTRSKGQPQEQATSSADEDAVEEIQQKASDITAENTEMSSPVEAEEGIINKDEPVKETKETVVEDDIKDHQLAMPDEDTLEKENEEVEGERVTTVEEEAVEESADAAEKKEEAPSRTDVDSVPLGTIQAEATEQTESTVETDKDAQPESVMEQCVEEAEPDKEPQSDSLTEEVDGKDAQSDAKDPEDATEGAVATKEASSVTITNQQEEDVVIETRVLRSGARTASAIATPRATRRSKRLVEEEVVETSAIKRGRKSAGRKQATRSKGQPQVQGTSSAEEDAIKEVRQETSETSDDQLINKDEPVEDLEHITLAETEETVGETDIKDLEPMLTEEDTLNKEVEEAQEERDATLDVAAVEESTSAIAVEEKEEASSTAQNPMEMDKETQPESVMEYSVAEAEKDKESGLQSLPEEAEGEEGPIEEIRSLRSGTKTVTATPKHTQSKVCVEAQIMSEPKVNEDVQSEIMTPEEVHQPTSPQVKDPVVNSAEAPEAAVDTEELSVAITNQEESLASTHDVIETRVLRSGARTTSTARTPRTTRRSKHVVVEEEIVPTQTIKRGRKSIGRKQVTSSKGQSQEQATSSAEEDTTQEVRQEISDLTVIEHIEASSPVAAVSEIMNKDEPVEESGLSETKDTVEEEDIKDPEHAQTEADTLAKNEDVQGDGDASMEGMAAQESANADAIGEEEQIAPTADVESVPLSTTETVEIEQTVKTIETYKEAQTESVTEQSVEEVGIDKELEQESLPEEADEEAPTVENRSLRSGTKTVTATPKRTQSKVSVEVEIASEPKDNEDTEKVPHPPSPQAKNSEATSDEAPDGAMDTEEVLSVAITNQASLTSTQDNVVETRVLRSEARTARTTTPRTTRRSQRLVEEEVIQTPTIKKGRKSAERKQVTSSKGQLQDQTTFSAEGETTEKVRQETSDLTVTKNIEVASLVETEEGMINDDEPVKDSVLTETKETVAKEDIKDQEPSLPEEDAVGKENEEVRGERLTTLDEKAVEESASADAPGEKEEAASTADVEPVPLSTTEAEETEQTESPIEMDKEAQPESVTEQSVPEAEPDKEPEPQSLPEEAEEADNEQYQAKDPDEFPGAAVDTEEVSSVTIINQEETLITKQDEGVERSLRRGSRTVSTVPTPITTRRSKRLVEEEVVETTTIKKGKQPAARQRVTRSKGQAQEQEISSAEEDETEMVRLETSDDQEKAKAASTADLESVPVSRTETEDTEQSERTLEMDKEAQPESVTEQMVEEAGPDKDLKPDSLPEEAEDPPSQVKDPEVTSEEVPEADVDMEEASSAITNQEESLTSTQDEVVETRVLRRGSRTAVPTQRPTRRGKRPVEEEVVETATIKRGRKSTARKAQEQATSSAEEDTSKEIQQQTSDITTAENIDTPSPVEAEEEIVNKEEPVKDSVLAGTTENIKDQEAALPVEDTVIEEDEEVQGERDTTIEEAAVEESVSAEAAGKKEEAASTTDVESVPVNTAEAEETEQTDSPIEMDKEAQPESVNEQSVEEAEPDREPEPQSIPEEAEEEAPIVETRSLRSGTKTVTATPKRSHTVAKEITEKSTSEEVEMEAETKIPEEDTSQENTTQDAQSELPPNKETEPKETEMKPQTSIEATNLPRVSVVLVDVNKLHVLKPFNEAAQSEQQGTPEEVQGQLEESREDATEQNEPEPSVAETNEAESHQAERTEGNDSAEVMPESPDADNTEEPHISQTRTSSRKRSRVDYREQDDKLDLAESLVRDDKITSPKKQSGRTRKSAPKPESEEEEEASDSLVLSLRLDEDEEESASDEEPIVITGINLRSRSVPSIVITPHSSPRHSTVLSPKESPKQTPPQLKRRSAKLSPLRTSKRHRK